MKTPQVMRERELDSGIITNVEGMIIANGFQQDLVFLHRVYDDGQVEILSRPHRGGEFTVLLPRHDPETQHPRCRHCGENL